MERCARRRLGACRVRRSPDRGYFVKPTRASRRGGFYLFPILADANPYIPAPSFLNSGDTAWQLTAATFVGMQSIPGLAILYAGLVKKKWALNSAVMCFYAFSIVLLCWVLWGYKMSFGAPAWGDSLKIMGSPFQALG